MNTDQAFEFLREAGVKEDICIQTVRRWLRDRKINYEGDGRKNIGYILEDTDQAFNLLQDAGVSENIGVQLVRRWLREGKIKNVGNGNGMTENIPREAPSNQYSPQDKIILQLKAKIKVQDEHLKEMEKLHQASINTLISQRNKLKIEIARLEKENYQIQADTKKLLKENIELRNELLKMKEEQNKGNKKDYGTTKETPPPVISSFHVKLGLSKNAGQREVLSSYKYLLKMAHPDHGGNASLFHYIKSDYDDFRNNIKG